MDSRPLVTVICLSYNQEKYVFEALNSVAAQEYKAIELIILDNGSTDNTTEHINTWLWMNTEKVKVRTLFYSRKINYCQAFNKGLSMAEGEYVIDLSGDDMLLPGHIAHAVSKLSSHPEAKVYSSNAMLINEDGRGTGPFFPINPNGTTKGWIPEGDVYTAVIARYCVCTPTLVFDRQTLVKEGGYNESLVYEDFDIVTRMARKYPFVYGDHLGVNKRIHKEAFSQSQYRKRRSVMLISTLKVCENILHMNQNEEEDQALRFRVLHEAKHALASANFDVAARFLSLTSRLKASGGCRYWLYKWWLWLRLDVSWLYERLTKK